MQVNDDIVSGWLSGSASCHGYDNPAGPLYIEGQGAIEAALTNPGAGPMLTGTMAGGTTCSLARGCACC
jgi:hypothetical protein